MKYNFKELLEEVVKNNTKENRKNLGEWFTRYGSDYWNGECFEIDKNSSLYPVYEEIEEDEFEIVDWELR